MLKGSHTVQRYDSPRIEQLHEKPDTTILTLDDPLTAEQEFYLTHHRSEKRTTLARNLGITKTRLNHQLYRLGG